MQLSRRRANWPRFAVLCLFLIFDPGLVVAADSPALIWSEEFDSGRETIPVDEAVWRHEIGTGAPTLPGWGNGERQYYTDSLANVFLRDGLLHIRAVLDDPRRPDGSGPTSARIMSRAGIAPQFGVFEIRAQIPCGKGAWPAIWMMGETGGWPERGEIDIAEWAGAFFSVDEMQMALHDRARHGADARVARFQIDQACGRFHVYQLQRTPTSLRISVDNDLSNPRLAHSADEGASAADWPFSQPFQLIFNVAIGGALGGDPDPSGPTEFEMLVDYVRVFELPAK